MVYSCNKSFESIAKTGARALAYSTIKRCDLFRKYHIVISSRVCGDILLLLASGVSPKLIIACDKDEVARECARKLGVIISPFPDIADTVKWANWKFGKSNIASVNVDLCATLHRGIPTLHRVFDAGILTNTKVFFTFLRSRDRLTGTASRIKLLKKRLPYRFSHSTYQSFTKDSVGSPMCMVVL